MENGVESKCRLLRSHKRRILGLARNSVVKNIAEKNLEFMSDINAMVTMLIDMRPTQVTLFYMFCRNQEFGVADYMLDIGADPNLLPPNEKPVWYLSILGENNEPPTSGAISRYY